MVGMLLLLFKLLILAFFSSLEMSTAVKIEIVPIKFNEMVITAVNVSCVPDHAEDEANEIVMIQILRGEQKMACVSQGSGILFGSKAEDFTSTVEAEGHIDPDIRNSFLRLTMRHIVDANSGKYSCLLYYVDGVGFMAEEKRDDDLTVDDPEMKTSLKYLYQQRFLHENRLLSQELLIKRLELQLESKTNGLLNLVRDQSKVLNELARKDSLVSSFTAGHKGWKRYSTGELVIFDSPVQKQGQGYDEKTGLYTAPTKGFYFFHVTSMTSGGGKDFQVDIQVNNKTVVTIFTRNQQNHDQSSSSWVVSLNPGDVVKVVTSLVIPKGIKIQPYPFSVFMGYLVKVL